MHIQIRARGIDVGANLGRYAETAFDHALGAHGPDIGQILVRFIDINGPRGGVDKRCLVQIEVMGQGHIVIDERSDDWYAAANEAARRAGDAVDRMLQRRWPRPPQVRNEPPLTATDGDLLHN